jgi:hypothetical protein
MPTPRPYEWNPSATRYFDPATGRFLSRDAVRKAFDSVIDSERDRLMEAANELRAGNITLAEWQATMRQAIKDTALNAAYVAVGGVNQMGAADYGWVGAYTREQYAYLNEFTTQIRNGLPLDGLFIRRAGMYASTARGAFHELQQDVQRDAGYTRERSLLHPAEHCDECVDQASIGIVPLGTCIPIGQRQCLGNCHCTMRYYP